VIDASVGKIWLIRDFDSKVVGRFEFGANDGYPVWGLAGRIGPAAVTRGGG
jgi:hypothetical protein